MNPPQSKAKVLHLITLSVVGGAQDNTFSTCERHDRCRYAVHLATNPDGQWIERARKSCDVFHPLPTLVAPIHPWKDALAFRDLVRLLRRERYDLVHTHSSKAGLLGRLAARFCGVLHVVHTYHGFAWHDFMPAWKRGFYIGLEQAVRSCADFYLTVSEQVREEAAGHGVLSKANSRTVYSGIEYAKMDQPADVAALRRTLGIPPGWPTVLMVGRLDFQKAPHLLIEGFAEVVKTHPETLLLLAGDGELRPQVEAQIARLRLQDRVRVLGFRSDIPALMQMADVFALSSLYEGLGRAMTEAMLIGKPVVVPAVNGIPEIVHHGETGLLYEPGKPYQLASHLNFLFDHPEEGHRLGANARRLTRQLFDVTQMVADIEQVYERLLSGLAPNVIPLPRPQDAAAAA